MLFNHFSSSFLPTTFVTVFLSYSSLFLLYRSFFLICLRYYSNKIYLSCPSSVFSLSPKIQKICFCKRSGSGLRTQINSRVSSTVILFRQARSYIRNCTRLKRFLGSKPVLSNMHLLYIRVNSYSLTSPSRSSSTSQIHCSTSGLLQGNESSVSILMMSFLSIESLYDECLTVFYQETIYHSKYFCQLYHHTFARKFCEGAQPQCSRWAFHRLVLPMISLEPSFVLPKMLSSIVSVLKSFSSYIFQTIITKFRYFSKASKIIPLSILIYLMLSISKHMKIVFPMLIHYSR